MKELASNNSDAPARPSGLRARFVHLNAARGIAAVIVAVDHYCLLFLPDSYMVPFETPVGQFFKWTVSSAAAVFFFFTLSAFVLTRKYFGTPDRVLLIQGAIKRYPRLYLSSAVSIAFAYMVLASGLNYGDAASQISGSGWLDWVHYNKSPVPLVASAGGALQETFLVLLLPDRALYNMVLWTMMYEFWGGLFCFLLAALLVASSRFGIRVVAAVAVVVMALFWHVIAGLPGSGSAVAVGTAMIVGVFIAYCDAHEIRLPEITAWPVIVLGLSLCAGGTVWHYVACGIVVLVGLVTLQSVPRALQGRGAQWLGDISFPLYLVHVIVIVSLGAWSFVTFHQYGFAPATVHLVTMAVTIIGVALATLPFVWLEQWWLKTLNRQIGTIGQRS